MKVRLTQISTLLWSHYSTLILLTLFSWDDDIQFLSAYSVQTVRIHPLHKNLAYFEIIIIN